MLTVTGKKVRYAAITALDSHEVPSHTTTIGAIARIGTVWDTMTYGRRPRSSSRKRAKRTARTSPVVAAEREADQRLERRVRGVVGHDQEPAACRRRPPGGTRRGSRGRAGACSAGSRTAPCFPPTRRTMVPPPPRATRATAVAGGAASDRPRARRGARSRSCPCVPIRPRQLGRQRPAGRLEADQRRIDEPRTDLADPRQAVGDAGVDLRAGSRSGGRAGCRSRSASRGSPAPAAGRPRSRRA